MKKLLPGLIVLLMLWPAAAESVHAGVPAASPNIIMFLADDLGY